MGELVRHTLLHNLRPPGVSRGLSADAPYLRKETMGAIVQGEWFRQTGTLRIRVFWDGDDVDASVRPCLPVGPGADGADFSFSLVFWQASGLGPEETLSPTYDFFKVFFRSAGRFTGSASD
jgi:hypothetical protein